MRSSRPRPAVHSRAPACDPHCVWCWPPGRMGGGGRIPISRLPPPPSPLLPGAPLVVVRPRCPWRTPGRSSPGRCWRRWRARRGLGEPFFSELTVLKSFLWKYPVPVQWCGKSKGREGREGVHSCNGSRPSLLFAHLYHIMQCQGLLGRIRIGKALPPASPGLLHRQWWSAATRRTA